MTWAWVIPASVAFVGLVVLAALAQRAAQEAAGLRRDMARFGDLRPAMVEVRDGAAEAARRLRSR